MSEIRVFIADDSAVMRKLLSDVLSSDPRVEVVGTARDGAGLAAKVNAAAPQVVVFDMEMQDGAAALEELVRLRPAMPITVVALCDLPKKDEAAALKAMHPGVFDFMYRSKSDGLASAFGREFAAELTAKVAGGSPAPQAVPQVPQPAAPQAARTQRREIVAIAASTGGPAALKELLSKLPARFPVPIVITQHMSKDFTGAFAKRLDAASALKVIEGEEGTPLRAGVAVVAPGGSHMVVRRTLPGVFRCGLSDAPPVLSVKPAANIMFHSVAEEFGGRAVGVVLTGMGRDGAEGAVALHDKGAYIIAESQETCVVYGMSKATVEAGAADALLPLWSIPDALLRVLGVRS
ncbi:MAG: chemotaxis-specific protein-glutamate methyltransferase CheB [Synergistaceae bacterium]|jgi:two-component system chemotaxis response regulator CheB|nr:chemotaxis-specific protein-glutamate methyltransferase CheB [Synergistaceae bacterium]